jgi:hypothetical protein
MAPDLRELSAERLALPGGVAHPQGASGYVVGATDSLEALDLAAGRLRWSLPGAVPLLAVEDVVLVSALDGSEAVRFLALDGASGARRFVSAPTPAAGERVFLAARLEHGHLLVAWRETRSAGAPASSAVERPTFDQERAVSVDLADGSVARATLAQVTPPPPPLPPGAEGLPLQTDQGGTVRHWATGALIAALAVEQGVLVLHTWVRASGAPRAVVPLLSPVPAPGYLRNYRPPDGAHLYLVRCNDRFEEGAPPGSRCRWLLFDVASGARVADLPYDPATDLVAEPALMAGRFYYAAAAGVAAGTRQARRLRGLDARNGTLLWEYPIAGRLLPGPAA